MKKLISILFILIMCGTLLPAVLPVSKQQQTLLLSMTEEEHTKEIKEKKEVKAIYSSQHTLSSFTYRTSSFPHITEAIVEPPCLAYNTPPPDINS
jgi:hypothetical protein